MNLNNFFAKLKRRNAGLRGCGGLRVIDPVWDPIRSDPGFQQLLTVQEHVGP